MVRLPAGVSVATGERVSAQKAFKDASSRLEASRKAESEAVLAHFGLSVGDIVEWRELDGVSGPSKVVKKYLVSRAGVGERWMMFVFANRLPQDGIAAERDLLMAEINGKSLIG